MVSLENMLYADFVSLFKILAFYMLSYLVNIFTINGFNALMYEIYKYVWE